MASWIDSPSLSLIHESACAASPSMADMHPYMIGVLVIGGDREARAAESTYVVAESLPVVWSPMEDLILPLVHHFMS